MPIHHDPRVIAKARADKAKGKGGNKGGGKGKRSGGKAAGGNRVCQFYLSAAGCKKGSECTFKHEGTPPAPAAPAAKAAAKAAAQPQP